MPLRAWIASLIWPDAWDDAKRRQNLAKHGIDLTLRLDQDLLDHFKAGGPGWQTRINDALRGAAKKTAAGR